MNKRLAILVATVGATGAAVLAFGASRYTADHLAVLLTLVVLGALAERYAVGLFDSHVSVGVIAVLAAGMLAGLWGVALVAPPIVLAGQLGDDAAWYKRMYNVATYLLAGAAFAGCFHAFGPEPAAWPSVLLPALLGTLANFAVNSGLVAMAIAVDLDEPLLAAWRRRYLWLLPQYMVVGLVATAAAAAYQVLGLWGLAVFAAPAAGIRAALLQGAPLTVRRRPESELARAA